MPDAPRAFDPRAAGVAFRRNMPHWRQDGALYFVTFRLADSLPAHRLEELRQLRTAKDDGAGPKPLHGIDAARQIDEWLHAGHGSCCLADARAGAIVEGALLHFDGQRYALGAYVVMPNHVHVLVAPAAGHELSKILHSWKSYTANGVNKALGRVGPLWQDESFDHIVRDGDARRAFESYIRDNPNGLPAGHARSGRGSLP